MLFRFLFALSLLSPPLLATAYESEAPQTYGAIESWAYDASTRELRLQGWSVGGRDGRQAPGLILEMAGKTYEAEAASLDWRDRPDIPSSHPATGGQAGLGFDWRVHLRSGLRAGVHPVRLVAVLPNDQRVMLKGAHTESPVVVVKKNERRSWVGLVLLLLGVAGIVHVRRRSEGGAASRRQRWLAGNRVLWLVGAVFMTLVALGVTGSSMGVLFKTSYGNSILDVQGASRTILGDEGVRGDEWGVQLPNLLAQLHHEPRFPVVNDFIGEGGQNMGVVGMTGVPVRQWAALARPATWGYFVLPLRQAMAWHWQLPFWGCLLALWGMLNVWRPAQRGLNLSLSLAFCVAPYAAAWSNWPLYVTMFPALAFVTATRLLQDVRVWRGVLLGACLGWLLACWALVLYPAWIIIVGSLIALLGAGWCIDNRAQLRFGAAQVAALIAFVIVLGALMGSWWLDTRDAIALMRATEYPGARGAMPGGDLGWWWHLRGYHNIESLRRTGPDSNPSEASSYLLVPLLILVLVALCVIKDRKTRGALAGAAAFIGCYWVYGMVGFPIEVARATLWGNVPVTRMDVGFGLLVTVLLSLFAPLAKVPTSWSARGAVVTLSVLSAGLVVLVLWRTPPTFVPNASSVVLMVTMAAAVALLCGWVLWGRVGSAVALMTWLHLLITLDFNPVRIGPTSVDLAPRHRVEASDEGRRQRTLVIGDGIDAMVFAAAGVPVVNGVFYYPHRDTWKRMGLRAEEWPLVNRYQHLGFYPVDDVAAARGYKVVLGSVDQVHVHIDPRRFDFACTGAERVVALAQWAVALRLNPSLTVVGTHQQVAWFAVRGHCASVAPSGA